MDTWNDSHSKVEDFVAEFCSKVAYNFHPEQGKDTGLFTACIDDDAEVCLNGEDIRTSEYLASLAARAQLPMLMLGELRVRELDHCTTNAAGTAGTVAEHVEYELANPFDDGKPTTHSATTLVRVEDKRGKQVVTGIWEVGA
ncbi:hypothetical protein Q5752_002048 [Cryptotrichosporon argae]